MNVHCSRCAWSAPIDRPHGLCPDCAAPLLVHYDLRPLAREELPRRNDIWRYLPFLPLDNPRDIVTLGEGATPLLPLQSIGAALGLTNLLCKDESKNPTRSFKARGMSVAVSMARKLGATSLAAPSAGNAGCALAAYGASAALPVFVAMPDDTPASIVTECRDFGAHVELVPGLITDAARRVQAWLQEHGGFDLSTLKEPYRIEGKKTMGYELFEDLGRLPDAILYPTGGGTGLIGMWKAFDEMQQLGWIGSERPRMYSVQAAGCAPIVRAFEENLDTAPEWQDAATRAWGLRVPRAIGDRLMLSCLRASRGGAIALEESSLHRGAEELRRKEGIDAGPEGGAAIAALSVLLERRTITHDETVVVFNTGGNKYG